MHSLPLQKWLVGAAALATIGFASLSTLQGQTTVFGTNFNDYQANTSLSGQPNGGGVGSWDTNDPDNGATTTGVPNTGKSIGQSDFVGPITGYNTGGNLAYLGGLQHGTTPASGVLPGQSTSYVFRPFTLPGAVPFVNFDVDFAIPESTAANGSTVNDKFAWTFRSGTTNLFSATFSPDVVDPGTGLLKFGLHYTVGNGTETMTTSGILSRSLYHLKISVNVAANSFQISLIPTNGNPTYTTASISLGGINPQSIDNVAATWILADTSNRVNGGYMNAGSNALVFDNYFITVPEPSTWAMAGLGLAGLAAFAYRRHVRA